MRTKHFEDRRVTSVKMFPARNGDGFLIKENGPFNAAILIDGGYASTFHDSILAELRHMHLANQPLDLVIATHIDADHISGLLELFRLNGKADSPAIIPIKNVWHNSLRCLSVERLKARLSRDDQDILNEICSRGFLLPQNSQSFNQEISARQGSSLAAYLLSGNYTWNNGDGWHSINSSIRKEFNINQEVKVIVLTPSNERLEGLRKKWFAELRRFGMVGKVNDNQMFDDAFEFLCSHEQSRLEVESEEISLKELTNKSLDDTYVADDSLNNSSSIAIIIKTPSSRMLFLGDAWAEDVVLAIRQWASEPFPIFFDLIKIAHHGSIRNTNIELLDLVDSPNFLFSTDGTQHNHPAYPVLKAIVDRPAKFVRNLHFNYATPATNQLKKYKQKSRADFIIHENNIGWITVGEGSHD